jgi:hypothetical protein
MLSVETRPEGDVTIAALKGTIDEDAELVTKLQGLTGKVRFELADVTAINSCGVREWINALREIEGRDTRIEFAGVSVALIQQFNMILNARGIGRVVSFHAPYYCEKCRKPREMLLSIAEHPGLQTPGELRAPARECPACGAALEFDEIEEKYLNFLEIQLKERRRA